MIQRKLELQRRFCILKWQRLLLTALLAAAAVSGFACPGRTRSAGLRAAPEAPSGTPAAVEPEKYTVRTGHPRLWLTPERLKRLKEYAGRENGAGTARWQKLKESADSTLAEASPSWDLLPNLAIVYQVTRNTQYADKAAEMLAATATPDNALDEDHFYYYRETVPYVAAAYDWIYDRLTPARRKAIAKWLMDRADQVWPDTNPARKDGWAVDTVSNNYYYGFMMTWPAALAAYGDDPRARKHIELALGKYRRYVRPFLDGWGRGGVFAESTNYDSTFRLAHILDAHLTATGVDLVNEAGFDFLKDSLLWRFHSTVPNGDLAYPLGDQPRVSSGALWEIDRMRALVPIATLKDPKLRQYARWWLDNISPAISNYPAMLAWEFLYFDEDVKSLNYGEELPLVYYAPGPGLLVGRSGWGTDATYWGIWAGPLIEGHQDRNVNGFLIYKGGWLAGNATLTSHSGILADTRFHNNITFGEFEQDWQYQTPQFPNPAGKVLKHESTAEYSYFVGSGANAYLRDRDSTPNRVAKEYVRKFVYLAPDTFLVYDRVELSDPNLNRNWRLHSATPITVAGRKYSFDNGAYRLSGQVLLPPSRVTLKTEDENFGENDALSSRCLSIVVGGGPPRDTILNVLQIAPITKSRLPEPKLLMTAGTGGEGAQCGGWIVLFGKTEKVTGQIQYDYTAASATQHLVLDLLPNTSYLVTSTGAGAKSTVTRKSTASGTLRFSGAAGTTHVHLAPQGSR